MAGQEVNVLTRGDAGREGARGDHFLAGLAAPATLGQHGFPAIGEGCPKAGFPAFGAQLKAARMRAPEHHGTWTPVRICDWTPRATVTSAVASAVSRRPPDYASLNGSRIRSMAPHRPT